MWNIFEKHVYGFGFIELIVTSIENKKGPTLSARKIITLALELFKKNIYLYKVYYKYCLYWSRAEHQERSAGWALSLYTLTIPLSGGLTFAGHVGSRGAGVLHVFGHPTDVAESFFVWVPRSVLHTAVFTSQRSQGCTGGL
ncbi:hypothetical protein EVAR_2578_1 [Eumeta japonica]|uniref:Uncharacterized protein n=1 Tax=Eumeta variegata TaxID=151549 RepID=A0A4C1SLU3_EUMVA|nr:hypothetical protein EVAR_2578_1 [Eumeta japonica]